MYDQFDYVVNSCLKIPKTKNSRGGGGENPQKTAMAFIFYIKQFKKLKLIQEF